MATARLTCGGTYLLLLIGIPAAGTASAAPLNILMIGNSYIQGNATARATSLDLQGLFDADTDFDATVVVRADSSASLQDHASNPVTTDLLTNPIHSWDVVVLQERSDRPALAMKNGGSHLTGLDLGGPALISSFIQPYQPQANIVLFNTWARAFDNEDLVDDFDNDPVEMLQYTNQGYERIRLHPPVWDYSDSTSVARVGDAWGEWYDTYGYEAGQNLHLSDGSHQNSRGAYLAAAVLFETITGKTSVGNAYAGAVTGNIDGISRVLLLQQQATAITGATEGVLGDYSQNGTVDAADYSVWRDTLSASASFLPNDSTPGVVDGSDFDFWRQQFGSTWNHEAGASSAVAIPEPESASLLLMAACWWIGLSLRGCGAGRTPATTFAQCAKACEN